MHACRTACRYGGKNIAFHVNEGSTSFWLSLLVEFEDGDGDIGSMQLKQVNNNTSMQASAYSLKFVCQIYQSFHSFFSHTVLQPWLICHAFFPFTIHTTSISLRSTTAPWIRAYVKYDHCGGVQQRAFPQ